MKSHKFILISDCTKFAGLTPGIYNSHIGGKVVLDSKGRLSLAEQPELLAGSAQSLLWCVNKLVQTGLLSLEQAWNKASLNPIELLTGEVRAPFQVGDSANLVLFKQDQTGIRILKTMLAGDILF